MKATSKIIHASKNLIYLLFNLKKPQHDNHISNCDDMATGKKDKRQTMVYKALHKKTKNSWFDAFLPVNVKKTLPDKIDDSTCTSFTFVAQYLLNLKKKAHATIINIRTVWAH